MEELRLGMYALFDIIKCLIIVYGILGLEVRKDKKAFWCIPIVILGVIGHSLSRNIFTFIDLSTQLLLVCFLFEEDFKTKIKTVIIQFVIMCTMDMLIWFSVVGLIPLGVQYEKSEVFVKLLCNVIVILLFIIISYLLKNRRRIIFKKIKNFKLVQFIFVILGLFSVSLVVSGIQGQYWNEMTAQIQKAIMVLGIFAVVFIFVLLILFVYVSDAKEKLQHINKLNEQCIKYQKDYYMEIIKCDEEMRAFKHDVNKHYEVLGMLINEKNWSRAQQYICQLSKTKDSNKVYKTGNSIADYIINGKIKRIKKQGNVEITVLGKFPKDIIIADTDLCIILGNALDNAEEALEKVLENKKLSIEIKSYKQVLFIEIVNSSIHVETKSLKTTKKDKINHGYGLENIRNVVEKYGGQITTKYQNMCFSLKIEL